MPKDLICLIAYNNFTIFKSVEDNNSNTCISNTCQRKKVGNIFFLGKSQSSYHQLYHWKYYIKRPVPYCSTCFRSL